MTCPKCGLQTLAEQKFCRACGTSLHLTTQPLPRLSTKADSKDEPTQTSERANRYVLWGFVVMLAGASIGVIGKKLMHEDLVTVIGVLISFVGMFLTVYPYLSPARRTKVDSSRSQQSDVITQSQPAKTLPPERSTEYVPSITERTTDLLEPAKRATSPRPSTKTVE